MRTNAKLTALLVAILFALLLNLAALGALVFLQLRHPKEPAAATTTAAAPAAEPASSEPAQASAPSNDGHHMRWHDAPLIAAVGGDDTEDVVGQFSVIGEGGQVTYYVGAFDGATLARLWRAGPLAVLERGERPPIVVLSASRVLAAEANTVHMYDVTNGDETSNVRASDRVTDLCAAGPERAKVWARIADGKHLLIDPATGEARPQEATPAGCGPAARPPKVEAPQVAGFASAKVLLEGDAAVAIGAKSPGTPIPTAVGFDPKSKKIRWQHPIAQTEDQMNVVPTSGRIAELMEGRLYASYRLHDTGWRFTAIDGKSGDRDWEAAIPDGNASTGMVTVTPARVYLAHATWLDLFDKITGRHVGTLGDHTPDLALPPERK